MDDESSSKRATTPQFLDFATTNNLLLLNPRNGSFFEGNPRWLRPPLTSNQDNPVALAAFGFLLLLITLSVAIVIAGLTVQWIVSRISNQPVGTDLHPLSLLAFAGPPISTLIFIAGVKQLRRHRHFVKNGVLLLGTIDWNRSETRELIQRSGGPGGSTTQGWNVTLVYYFTNPDGQAILTSKEFVSHKAPGWFVTHSKKYVAVLYLAENMYDIL